MKILLTNDDGIHAPGIRALYEGLKEEHSVTVIAPESEQSAVGHAITLLKPLRIKTVRIGNGFEGFAVDGTPADCVKIGVKEVIKDGPPDLVISGVNLGANVGIDALYSGTVSAATEGAILSIPSMAVSLDTFENPDFGPSVRVVRALIAMIKQNGVKKGTALNVNVPAMPWEKIAGIAVTRHGESRYLENFDQRVDPRGNVYYWQAGGTLHEDERHDADRQALRSGKISVTPLHFDLTDYEALEQIRRWGVHMRSM